MAIMMAMAGQAITIIARRALHSITKTNQKNEKIIHKMQNHKSEV
jgi:hypothetical protein